MRLATRGIVLGLLAALVMAFAATPVRADVAPSQQFQLRNKDGRLEEFKLVNGALYHRWQNSSTIWSSWYSLGGSLFGGISGTSNQDGRLEIFGVASPGLDVVHIWQHKPNGTNGWSNWHSLGGTVNVFQAGVHIDILVGHLIHISVYGPDNMWHYKQQRSPNGNWTPNWL